MAHEYVCCGETKKMSRVKTPKKGERKIQDKDCGCEPVKRRESAIIGQLTRASIKNQPDPAATIPTVEVAVFGLDESSRKSLGVLHYHTSDNSVSVRRRAQLQVSPQLLIVKGGAIGTAVTSSFFTWLRIKRGLSSKYVDVPNSTWSSTFTRPTDSVLQTPQYTVDLNPGDRLQVLVGADAPNLIGTVHRPPSTVGSVPIPAQPSARLSILAFSRS